MTALTFPLAAILAIFVIAALASLHRALSTYYVGRELLKATGSKREARLAIENVRLERALARKFGEEFVRSTPRRERNVVRFVPRIVSNGVPLHFDNDKGAA